MSEWQPLETAPKHGVILLWVPFQAVDGGRCVIGYWDWEATDWREEDDHLLGPSYSPTHWMPLPAPPTEGGER